MEDSQLNVLTTRENPASTETRNMVSGAAAFVCGSGNNCNPNDFSISPIITEFRQQDFEHVDLDMDLELDRETEREIKTTRIGLIKNEKTAVNVPNYALQADYPTIPCKCIATDVDIYSVPLQGPQLHIPFSPHWGRTDVVDNMKMYDETILTQDGIVNRDNCWCGQNDTECWACCALRDVLWDSDHSFAHLSIMEFLDCLNNNPFFSFELFVIDTLNDFGEPSLFMCIKYFGPMKQPSRYHVSTVNSPFVDRLTWVGPLASTDLYNSYHIDNDIRTCEVTFHDEPTVELRLHEPMRLATQCALMVSRFPTIPKYLEQLLRFELENFRSGDIYYLPLKADSMGRCEAPPASNNLKLAPLVTACGDEDTSVGERSIVQDQQHNVDLAETTDQSDTYVATEPFDVLPWITEEKHEYPDLTGRWTKAFSFQWTTAQTQGSIIQSFDLPLEAIQNFRNAPNALPWTQHAFYRADMELKVQVNSQPAQSGYLALGVMYNASAATAIGNRVEHVANIVQMPHNRISAGASNSGVMHIPFIRQFPVGCVLDNNYDVPQYVATLFVSPLLQLRTGPEGPQVVDVTIMIRFPRCEFYGQRDRVEVVTAQGWVPDLTVCGDVESNPGPIGMLGALAGAGGLLRKVGIIASGVGSAANSVANSVGSVGSTASAITNTVESLLRPLFPKQDADRPQNILEPLNLYLQQNTSLSLGTGTNVVKLLQLQAENMTSHPPALVPSDDQFSTAFIVRTFGIIDFIQWSSTAASGTMLWEYDVTPLQHLPAANNSFFPTPMSALGHYYGGFHGDILLRFTFAISKFHSGRVYIVYVPDKEANFDNVGSYYGTLLDVQDQSQYTFVIPYQVPTTFAPLYNEPVGWQGFDQSVGESHVVTYGKVYVFVENQLRVMQTASPVIDILVEQAGAPNFNYVIPSASESRSLPTVTAMGVESAPNVEDQVASEDERQQVISASTNVRKIFPTWAVHLNENFDIRDLCKRYTPWFNITSAQITASEGTNLAFTTITVMHVPTPPFYAQLSGWGPIIEVAFRGIPVASGNFRTNLALKQGVIIARERINLNTNNTISFRVPWMSTASMLSNSLDPDNGRPNQLAPYCNGRIVVIVEPPVSTIQNVEGGAQYVAWDVTSGSASLRGADFVPDLITLLHDAFRFTKADFMYQLDVQPIRVSTGLHLNMRCFRSLGDGGNFYVFQGFPRMFGVLNKSLNAIGGTPPEPGNLIVQQRSKWKRDLTQDGDVEANPGPVVSRVQQQEEQEDPIHDPLSGHLSDEEREALRGGRVTAGLFERIGEFARRLYGWTFAQTLKFVESLRGVLRSIGSLPGITHIVDLIATVRQLELVTQGLNRASAAMERLSEQVRTTTEGVGKFITAVKGGEPDAVGRLVSQGIEYVALIVNIWNSPSVGMTILNVAALLSKMGLGTFLVHSLVDSMGVVAQGEDDGIEREYASLIITGLLGAIGLSSIDYGKASWFKEFVGSVKDFFRTGFNVKKFLDSHFKCISDLCTWVKYKVFGKVQKEGLSEDLLVWCEKVHRICEVYNFDHMLNDPEFADTVMALREEAFEFDKLFMAANVKPPNQYNIYRSKLQKSVDMMGQQGTMQRSKPVPFCVWVYGKSGCGKSHISDTVLIELGEALGLDTANSIYTRSPDVEFWNGYTSQKLVSWQDFGKVSVGETYRKQVSELSSLIEPTPFNPPFAALEDKRKLADAWVVYVSSNKDFPDVQSIGMIDSALFYRRRHALVHMRISPAIITEYAAKGIQLEGRLGDQIVYFSNLIPPEDFDTRGSYFHVEFGFHSNGIDRDAPTEWLGYDDFVIKLKQMAVVHRTNEIKACERRRALYNRLRRTAPSGMEFPAGVKSAHEELRRMQENRAATAQAGDFALKNLATTVDEQNGDNLDTLAGSGCADVNYAQVDPAECDHEQSFTLTGEDSRGHKLYRVVYCRICDPMKTQKDKVTNAYRNNPSYDGQGVENTDPGVLPSGARQFTFLDYMRQATTGIRDCFRGTGLPEGYAHWSELIPTCCHHREILRLAYFERVNGKIELVVDMSDLVTTVFWAMPLVHWLELVDVRRYRAMAPMYKIILPVVCEQSKFKWLNRVVAPDASRQVGYPCEDAIGFNSHMLPRSLPEWGISWACSAVDRPSLSYYRLDGDMLRYLVRGTYVEVQGEEDIVHGLNHLMGMHTQDPVAFCNTFFHWKSGGSLRTARLYPFVNAMLKDVMYPWRMILVAIGAVLIAYKLYRLIRGSADMVSAQAASQSGDIRKTEAKPPPKIAFVQQAPTVVTAQGDDKLPHIHNSLCKLSKGSMTLYGVRLCSTYVLAPLHLSWVEGDFTVQLQHNGVWTEPFVIPAASVKLATVSGYDYAVYKFLPLPAARNIMSYFTTRAQSNTIRSDSELLSLVGLGLVRQPIRISLYRGALSYDNKSFKGKGINMVGWQYWLGTANYLCGSLVWSNGLLCGMHVAQNLKTGDAYAVSICKEMLVDALKQLGATEFDMKVVRKEPKSIEGVPKMQPPEGAVVIPIGKASDPVRYSGKSNLEPSVIQGEVTEPFRYPAAQAATAKGEMLGYDVVMTGCEKQFSPPKAINQDEVKTISEYLVERIVNNSPPVIPTGPEPLSLGEAVAGIDGVPFMSSMKLNTSIGWPLANEYKAGAKKSDIITIDREQGLVSIDPVAYQDYEVANKNRQEAICAPTVFMDFPKDELLKPGKATRLINGAPLNHTLDMRRYLMEFFAAITLITNKIAVGVDVHSNDWALVHSGTDSVVDEDYSGFGPGFHSEWLTVVVDLAVRWCKKYKKVDQQYENVVRCLLEENKNAYHVAGDLIYQVWCGSPSGAYATDRINSVANLCYHCLCYLRKYHTLTGFWDHYCLVYGDDTRREETAYTGDEFEECMRSVGIVVKRDKSGTTSFLKRQFVPLNYKGVAVMLAPLPMPIVGDILNWVRRPYVSPVDAVVETVGAFLSEIFHHGPVVFDNYRRKIQGILAKHGAHPELATFDDLFRSKYLAGGAWPVIMGAPECEPAIEEVVEACRKWCLEPQGTELTDNQVPHEAGDFDHLNSSDEDDVLDLE